VSVLRRSFFARSVHEVAPDLIGVTLLVDGVGGRIVEVEAYDQEDHWCLNLVCGEEGIPEAALIRALEPTAGIPRQQRRRGTHDLRRLCSGPGKLCQALAITREHDGLPLDRRPFRLQARAPAPEIVTAPRVGITRATELSWRYLEHGSPFLSRPAPREARRS
jgi:DNA-3-methyladenine glycosylase